MDYSLLVAVAVGAILVLAGAVVGGWLVYRGKATQGDQSFFGKPPKGEAFVIPDNDGAPLFPGSEEPSAEEKHVLKKTEDFLANLTRGKDK